MSKAIKSVGRSLKKVWKATTGKVWKEAKRFAKSDIGKALLIAGTIYFGGAALGGMMSGAGGAGASMLGNATAGISNAWTGLTGATSAAMGGNFAQAGQSLAAGAKGGTVASSATNGLLVNAGTRAGGTITGTGTANAGAMAGQSLAPKAATALESAVSLVQQQAPELLTEKASGGLLSKALSSPYTIPMAMQVGGQALSGAAQAKAAEEQDEEARKTYNKNVGAANLYTSRY